MGTEWFVVRGGKKFGPYTSAQLKTLAASGKVRGEDLLWKEGMDKPRPAGSSKALFPEQPPMPQQTASAGNGASSAVPVQASTETAPHEPPASSTKAVTLADRAKAAAVLASLAAERTKLSTLTLPACYRELGQSAYHNRSLESRFSGIFQQLDSLAAEIEQANKKGSNPENARTISEKAKALAASGVELAKMQKASLKQSAAFLELGKGIYEAIQADSSPLEKESKYAAIASVLQRLEDIDRELASYKGKASGGIGRASRTKLVIVGGGAVAAAALWAAFSMFRSTDAPVDKRMPQIAKDISTDKGLSPTNSLVPDMKDVAAVSKDINSAVQGMANIGQRFAKDAEATARENEKRAKEERERARQRAEQQAMAEKPSGPTKGDMQMAESALRELLKEQKLLSLTGGGTIGLLPPVPRVKKPVPIHTTPRKIVDSQKQAITALAVFQDNTFAQINDRIYLWPSLDVFPVPPSAAKLDRLTFFREISKQAGQYADFESQQRARSLPQHFAEYAKAGAILGDKALELKGSVFAVLDQRASCLAVDQRSATPAALFWRMANQNVELIDAFALRAHASMEAWRGNGEVVEALAWEDKLVLMTTNQPQGKQGKSLAIWNVEGCVGSMQLEKRITESSSDYPFAISVAPQTGALALLYANALRIIDLNAISGPDKPLNEKAVGVFDSPSPIYVEANRPRILWTHDGNHCIVQRTTEGGDTAKNLVVEIYDKDANLTKRLEGDRAGNICDVADDGKYMALTRQYMPLEGTVSSVPDAYEIELVSLPECTSLGRVYTCFARQVDILPDGTVVSGGISADMRRGMVMGGWDKQAMNERVGGHYVTRWDVLKGQPLWRIKDVDVDDLLCVADGKWLLTTRRKLGNSGAAVCLWECDRAASASKWVDEFTTMRKEVIDDEVKRRQRITLPAPPLEQKDVDTLQEGITYYEIKERVGGAGRMEAKIVMRDDKPWIEATVEYDASGDERAVYLLFFESPGRMGNLRMENQLKLVKKERR